MLDQSKLNAVRHIMATLFSAQNALRELAPEFRWAGLGNLLGDYGEFVAIEAYGLSKAPPGSGGYDAKTTDGRTVQIKANHAASQIGFRGDADLLLVLKVDTDGTWAEVYYGPFPAAKALARYSARDNKHMVAVRHLRALNEQMKAEQIAVSISDIGDGVAASDAVVTGIMADYEGTEPIA